MVGIKLQTFKMFKKNIKIKSNNQLKASERKNFKDLLLKTFHNLTEDQICNLLPKKEVLNILKVVTSDDVTVHVYTIQKRPMIFEMKGKIFPTVYFLWKFPKLIQAFTIHQGVMQYITSGADLMLPGVVTPPSHTGLSRYGSISENEIVYVNLNTNIAAVAVGCASQSSQSMALANGKGRCVNIYHFYGDNLCSLEGMAILPIVNLEPPEWLQVKSYEEDFPVLGSSSKKSQDSVNISECTSVDPSYTSIENPSCSSFDNATASTSAETIIDTEGQLAEASTETVEDMDAILMYCFLGGIKYSKVVLPVLTSNFFKLHMLPLIPENKTLDIKKTSYKKLKPFLEKMAEEGLITVKEAKKGVEQITTINQEHVKFKEFYISPEKRQKKEGEGTSMPRTDVVESYVITQNVLPLFQGEGFHKGDSVQGPDVRKYVTKYIKEHNLQDENNASLVKPKDVLATICKTEHSINWEEVMEKVCESMKSCYMVKTGTEEIVNKGKVSPITMTVSVRSGNKKVTLVDNLELFGIRLAEFAKECQHGVAASTSISRPPGKKCDQLLVQGNQVLFIYQLLTEKYKISKKFIQGLENAPKKKK